MPAPPRPLAAALLFACAAPPAGADEETRSWTAVEVAGVDYLPLGQIRDFYKFERMEARESEVTLLHSRTRLRLLLEEHRIEINGIPVSAFRPFAFDDEGQLMVSALDLVSIIDPVLRPARIKREPIRGVKVKIATSDGLASEKIFPEGVEETDALVGFIAWDGVAEQLARGAAGLALSTGRPPAERR